MPRQARLIVSRLPRHIVQRRYNRSAVFIEDSDYQYYFLRINHIHLTVEAGDRLGDIGELMKRLAGRQSRYVNKLEKRRNWDRHCSAERLAVACMGGWPLAIDLDSTTNLSPGQPSYVN